MSKKQGKSGKPKLPHGWHVITNKEAADIVRHASTGKIEIRPTGEKWPKFDFVVVGLKSACCKADVSAQCISIDYPDGFFWTCSSCNLEVDEKGFILPYTDQEWSGGSLFEYWIKAYGANPETWPLPETQNQPLAVWLSDIFNGFKENGFDALTHKLGLVLNSSYWLASWISGETPKSALGYIFPQASETNGLKITSMDDVPF